MQEAIARFEGELRELALTLARDVVAREAARRAGAVQGKGALARRRGRQAKEARSGGKRGGRTERRKAAAEQLPLQLPPPPPRPASEVVTEVAPAAQPATSAQRSSKRIVWTADSVIDALVPFVKSRMEVDASFVKRHGPKGLVAAAIRFFGRYPAALNRASLHAAKLAAAEPAAPTT